MAKGLPDYTAPVKLQAWDGTALRDVRVDANGQLYMLVQGYTGTTYIPILVDAAGNLIAVIKGEYAGTLKTVLLDSAGRMLAKVVDDLDVWGQSLIKGNAEAAAMLGSIKTYDRRGDVLWMEGFDGGLDRWVISTVGTLSTAYVSYRNARSHGLSCRLEAGNAADDQVELRRGFAFPFLTGIGLEIAWTAIGDEKTITFLLDVFDGTNETQYGLRYDFVNARLQYLDSAGAWINFGAAVTLTTVNQGFNITKLVIDTDAKKYVRALVNATSHSLANIGAWVRADTTSARATLLISYVNRSAATTAYDYVDDLIVTHNEPT